MRPAHFRSDLSVLLAAIMFVLMTAPPAHAWDLRVYEQGQRPNDRRLDEPKDLNGYFPFTVPKTRAAWETRAEELRRRILVANGLWPMPKKTPLNAVIYGKAERPGFTIEKIYFESFPGHFVSGLLFRPADDGRNLKRPAILCPHGHGGRLQDYGAKKVRELINAGAERFEKSGRFPKLARCGQLARMGCVVLAFDMLGYADSTQITYQLAHRFAKQRPEFEGKDSWGLFSTQAELRLQSVMGIQTWNAIRCLDFLQQLPDVDPERLAVTGGSGGGTQTILLCAIDPRPITAFPQGMVSTSMQGGCTCENCCLLRVDAGNVELAALFAPKPLAMTAADDWTKDMMTKGYPELQQLYELMGVKQDVYCRALLQFPHNFNYVTRATMYTWFNKHLKLGLKEPIVEQDFEPLTSEETTVWNAEHKKPDGGDTYERSLTAYLAAESDKQIKMLVPTDAESLPRYREVVGGALRSIVGRGLPDPKDIKRTAIDKQDRDGITCLTDILRLESSGEELPVVSFVSASDKGHEDIVIWIDGDGKRNVLDDAGNVRAAIRRLLEAGTTVVAADLFQQGEFLTDDLPLEKQRVVKNPRESAAYTFAYNDTLFARRVHDILTLVSWASHADPAPKRVHLVGVNGAGSFVAAARAIAGGAIDRTAVDTAGFRFANLTSYRDPNFLPGAVKYGDLPAMLALSAPHALWIAGENGKVPDIVARAYAATGKSEQVVASASQDGIANAAVDWLLSR